MAKNNKDYDNVFKTLKYNHTRLFVPIINKFFDKKYPIDAVTTLLPTGGIIDVEDSSEEKDSDFLMCVEKDTFLLECQSYPDSTMAIRIAEYSFNAAKNNAADENGRIILEMPAYSIIYVKSNSGTPRKTEISYKFSGGEVVRYDSDNIILSDYTKEEIVKEKLFVLIPFYITRYEKALANENGDLSQAESDLKFFDEELERLYLQGVLQARELVDIRSYINRIIMHITDGNNNEERMVDIMGGQIEETPSHEIQRLENEKIAYSLFENGTAYNVVRKSITIDMISDNKLKEIMEMATTNKAS